MPRSGRFAVLAAECAVAPGSLLSANSAPVQVGSQASIRNKVVINDGFVIGGIYDSTQRNPIYPRIDIGDTCRWDQSAQCWTRLLERAPHENLNWTGVESIAIDPVNPHILHLAVDAHALDRALNSAIYRAADGCSEHYLLNLTNQYVLAGPYPAQTDDWDMAATTALTPEAIVKLSEVRVCQCPKKR
jgi:hypothetical protein